MPPLCPIYAITDPKLLPGNKLYQGVEQAIAGGVTTIQYRDKTASAVQKLERAQTLSALCKRLNAQLIINDDPELATTSKAHGVHLGQADGSVEQARKLLGPDAIVGVTCHNQLPLALSASRQGASYVAFGRFYSSSTKPLAGQANPEILTAASAQLSIPVVAIGGINRNNMAPLIAHGASSLAVCHGLFASDDITTAAQTLMAAAKQVTFKQT